VIVADREKGGEGVGGGGVCGEVGGGHGVDDRSDLGIVNVAMETVLGRAVGEYVRERE
jgi:hypothetical protein